MKLSAFVLVVATRTATADVTVGGYLEADYQLHLQDPDNRITSLRGFDNRSRTFTLQNVALDVKGTQGAVTARVIWQVGHTPSSYYLAEPALPGSSGVGPSNSELWKYLQTATISIDAPLLIEAGLFPSPIGPEVLAVKDNWNWSRSDLFVGLPFYHAGARASRKLGCWTATTAVYNGWNSVADNNGTPSVAVSAAYANGDHLAQVLYFGGIERDSTWRHLVDAYVQQPLTKSVTVLAHGDAGFEGDSWWVAGALSGKLALSKQLYAAARADAFYERGAIFWPTRWIGSGTLTLAYQLAAASLRIEVRHDHAASDAFYGGAVDEAFNRRTQDTITAGATAWF